MKAVKTVLGGLTGRLPSFKLPTLGREVAIQVYVVHNSTKPEDYFFIFDFEEFVERSQTGMFVRPKLKVWAGRDDFDRAAFARQFRTSFSKQFDAARRALATEQKQGGWFGWVSETVAGVSTLSWQTFVAHVVLLVAVSAGRGLLNTVLPKGLFSGRRDAQKLEENIEATKEKVDQALARLEVVLHWELCAHAFYGDRPDGFNEDAYDTWPLPDYVREHLDDKETGAFW